MTRREWNELAAAIKHELDVWTEIEGTTRDPLKVVEARTALFAMRQMALRVSGVLAANSARFDAKRFLAKCGIV